ncbi:hypothetical protein HKX48_004930 [Thoreauomyces humboldtii]|nr:hypothetical protein HKX48_004930 [Thoreauomyces humboldtii]
MSDSTTPPLWVPLPKGVHGVVTSPYIPSKASQRASTSLSLSSGPSSPVWGTPAEVPELGELVPLELGDAVHLLEECDGWLRGYVFPTIPRGTGPELGIFPAVNIFSRALLTKRATASADRTPVVVAGSLGPLPVPAAAPSSDQSFPVLDGSAAMRPGLSRGMTAPIPHLHSLPAAASKVAERVVPVGVPIERPPSTQRPSSYAPGFAVGTRKVVHPIPASVRPFHETAAGMKESLIDEIAAVLRDWGNSIKSYIDRQQYEMFTRVHALFEALSQGRRTLLSQTLKQAELVRLRKQLICIIEEGNQLQSADLVIRHTEKGHILSERNTTIINIYRMHLQQAQARVKGNARTRPANLSIVTTAAGKPVPAGPSSPIELEDLATRLTYMFCELKSCTGTFCLAGEYTELRFALYNQAEKKMISEDHIVHVSANGLPPSEGLRNGKTRTIFADIPYRDLGDKVYLTCRLVRVGKMNVSEKESEKDRFGLGSMSSMASLESSASSLDLPSLSGGAGVLATYRRPLGWSAVRVGEWLKAARGRMAEPREVTMRIYAPTSEASFPTLYENIITKSGGYEYSARAESLTLSLNVIQGDFAALAERDPTLLERTMITPQNGLSDVIVPGHSRNALYLTLVSGEFTPGRKSNVRNVEVTAQIRLADGSFVESCLSSGTGQAGSGALDSLVYYHTTNPRWNETMRIDLQPDVFKKAHIFFSFRHCSSSDRASDKHERNFAFAFLPLLRGGQTVINDSSHGLTLYKWDKRTATPAVYLNYSPGLNVLASAQFSPTPEALAAAVDALAKVPALKDSFSVRTQLCSTRLTQNVSLHNLLHWRTATSRGRQSIETILTDFIMIGELEIIKFLASILESLFAILDHKETLQPATALFDLDRLVFSALVFTLGIVTDKRFTNHRSTVDRYINTKFKSLNAWEVLMHGFEKLIRHPDDVIKARELRNSVKVWGYLLKFAIRSDGLSSARARRGSAGRQEQRRGSVDPQSSSDSLPLTERAEFRASGPPTDAFIQSLTSLFAVINEMMALTSPDYVIATQTLTLQYFPGILPDLAQIFPPSQLVNMAATFVDSVRSNRAKLNGYKLLFIKDLIKGFLFADGQSRGVLVNCVTRWVSQWARDWTGQHHGNMEDGAVPYRLIKGAAVDGERENVKPCLDVVTELVDKLQRASERREKDKFRAGRGQRDGNVDPVSAEEHEATVMCVAELLPKLLEMYVLLLTELDGDVGLEGRLQRRERAGSRPPVNNGHEADVMPRSQEIAQLGAILLAIAHLLKDEQIQSFLVKYYAEHGARDTVRLVSLLCESFGDMISDEPFSPAWVSMNMLAHRVTLKMLRPVSELLRGEFLGARDEEEHHTSNRLSVVFSIAGSDASNGDLRSSARSFQTGGTLQGTGINGGGPSTLSDASGAQALIHRLWDRYFHVLLQLLNSRWLQIERFGPQRARVAHKLGADVRGEGGEMLRTMWEHLASTARGKALQAGFIPSLVGPFLQLTASPHPILRSAAIELLFNTIGPEFEQVGHFGRVELECIERLHRLVTQDKLGDDAYRRFIVDALERRFVTRAMLSENDDDHGRELTDQGHAFLNCLDTFLMLSLQIRDLPAGEQHDDERAEALIKMLRFLRNTGRRGVYVEYVHRLYEMQLEANNPVEAALALKLHGDLFEWRSDASAEPLSPYGYPDGQTEFERKETIYLRCIELLESGQAWERAVELCRELGSEYEKHAYSYSKLSDIMHRQADMYASIATTSRSQPEYYRVGFYGQGCPASLRNNQYVYRGGDWEKLGTFCDRLLQQYVGGKLARSNAYPPPTEITDGEGLWLQVTAVKPVVDTRGWSVGEGRSGALGALKWERSKRQTDEPLPSQHTSQERDEEGGAFADLLLIEPDLNVYLGSPGTERGGSSSSVAMDKLDERVRAYYESNEVEMFSFSRPMRKPLSEEFSTLQPGDPAREFLELWTEKIVLVTQDRFPCLSRRNPVIRVEMFELSPVENAVIAVRAKTRQLTELEKRFAPYAGVGSGSESHNGGSTSGTSTPNRRSSETGLLAIQNVTAAHLSAGSTSDTATPPGSPQLTKRISAQIPSVNPFTMALNGAVDAPVNGGIPMYRRAFLSNEYRAQAERDGNESIVSLLERAIEEQVEVLHRCLIIHDKIVPQPMRPLHTEIIGLFHRNFADDISHLGLPILKATLSIAISRLSDGSSTNTIISPTSNTTAITSNIGLPSLPHAAGSTSFSSVTPAPSSTPTVDSVASALNRSSSATKPRFPATATRRRSSVGLRHSTSTASTQGSRKDATSPGSTTAFASVLEQAVMMSTSATPAGERPAPPQRSASRGALVPQHHSQQEMDGGGSSPIVSPHVATASTDANEIRPNVPKKDRFGTLGKLFDNLR